MLSWQLSIDRNLQYPEAVTIVVCAAAILMGVLLFDLLRRLRNVH